MELMRLLKQLLVSSIEFNAHINWISERNNRISARINEYWWEQKGFDVRINSVKLRIDVWGLLLTNIWIPV